MRRTRFDDWPCPIARTTDLIGDWWTPLVMREAFLGRRRFDEFQAALSIPRAVLAERLKRLVAEEMLDKTSPDGGRAQYGLTDKGRAFWDVLAAMWRWGEDWLWDDGEQPELVLRNSDTGERIRPLVIDERTGEPLELRTTKVSRRRAGDE
ncbi:MAG: winged helix-turn-helix transcriptional regulator [Acidimicrobiales bacterium]